MGVIISDTFTDTNGTAITAHTVSPTNTPGGAWGEVEAGTWTIQSNKASGAGDTTPTPCFLSTGGAVDLLIDAVFNVATKSTSGAVRGIAFRMDSSGTSTTAWTAGLKGSDDTFCITEGSTVRASTSKAWSGATNYALQVDDDGAVITATVDGGSSINYASATAGGQYVGMRGRVAADTFDSLVVTVPDGASFIPFPYPRGMAGGVPSLTGGLSVA